VDRYGDRYDRGFGLENGRGGAADVTYDEMSRLMMASWTVVDKKIAVAQHGLTVDLSLRTTF